MAKLVFTIIVSFWIYFINSEVIVKRETCGHNEMEVECVHCGPKHCSDLGRPIKCSGSTARCNPECVCIDGYVRNDNGTCIPKTECDSCGGDKNATSGCGNHCGNSCSDYKEANKTCFSGCPSNSCDCRKGYVYHDKLKICVLPVDCWGYEPCESACTPTCAVPNPPNCDSAPPSTCCQGGYVLSEIGGTCIPIENCPTNATCNGDPNAVVKACPAACPSTCDSPNAFYCRRDCKAIGCECKHGFLLNKDGKCVKPEQCPGGNPCRKNEIFVACKVPCPTDYCPTSDSRAVIACDPPFPCLSGCVCNLNHKKKSQEDHQCIVSSDCPPVKCTRQNEEWSPCPSACLSEYCDAVDQPPVVCHTLVHNCDPSCVCTKNHFRNSSDICISAAECRNTTHPLPPSKH